MNVPVGTRVYKLSVADQQIVHRGTKNHRKCIQVVKRRGTLPALPSVEGLCGDVERIGQLLYAVAQLPSSLSDPGTRLLAADRVDQGTAKSKKVFFHGVILLHDVCFLVAGRRLVPT